MPVFWQPPLTIVDMALTRWDSETQWMDESEKRGKNGNIWKHQVFIFFHMLVPRLEVQTSRCDALTTGGFIVNLPVFLLVIMSLSEFECILMIKIQNSSLFWIAPPLEPKVHWPSVVKGSVHQAFSHLGSVLYAEKHIRKLEIKLDPHMAKEWFVKTCWVTLLPQCGTGSLAAHHSFGNIMLCGSGLDPGFGLGNIIQVHVWKSAVSDSASRAAMQLCCACKQNAC